MDLFYLNRIKSPEDVRNLKEEELPLLAGEVREVLIETVSKTGGHLASNLGVVELTIAIHRVFNSPKDKIIFDVGHQAYTHKLFTGRLDKFSTLRTEGGISGFTRPTESEHDMFYSGHSSTSVSAALGIASANAIKQDASSVVAVLGDGSLTGGLVYEALNNAGRTKRNLIVILNDNEMSISENVGSIARYLAISRSKPEYFRTKAKVENMLNRIPFIGHFLSHSVYRIKSILKNAIYSNQFFEDIGFKYMGPLDGHNISLLEEALRTAKMIKKPVLVHVNTIKGKGYDYAERAPSQFHGISKFDINTGEPVSGGTSFSDQFGAYLCELAREDKRICAITAAMSLGTGIDEFSKKYPKRFFDVGIAEAHAVTFASGLARGGMLPVFAVYSTFLQRAYDQLIHDVALQKLPIIIAIDRAGFVGEDGETHQGIFDAAFLNTIPDLNVYSPSSFEEMRLTMSKIMYKQKKMAAIRYPRGNELPLPEDYNQSFGIYDIYGDHEADITLVTYGRIFSFACRAVIMLREMGINAKVCKLNRISPIAENAVHDILNSRYIFFFEEGIKSGGIGESMASKLLERKYDGEYKHIAVDDRFVQQASVDSLLKKYKLNTDGMLETVLRTLGIDETEEFS